APTKIELRIPEAYERQLAHCRLHCENGETRSLAVRLNRLRTVKRFRVGRMTFMAKDLLLADLLQFETSLAVHASRITHHLPQGYHHLSIEIAGHTSAALLISAPLKSYSDSTLQKSWGAFLPMYAAHSETSWGAGNFGDWRKLAEWIAS